MESDENVGKCIPNHITDKRLKEGERRKLIVKLHGGEPGASLLS
jgi:hypothetical protein